MKPEQLDKLEQLQDKLLTVAVDDCDPENWTGYGQKPRDMDRQTRGNAIYDRKLAGQTLACLVRVGNIIDSPANVDADSRYELANPFPKCHVICIAELLIGSIWGETGWIYINNVNYGTKASMLNL